MSSPLTKDLLQSDQAAPGDLGVSADVVRPQFYGDHTWLDKLCVKFFKVNERGVSIKSECYSGIIQFISCVYILPVVSSQLAPAGFDADKNVVVTSATAGIGCIIAGLLTNLPMIVAPSTPVTIFYSVYLQENSLKRWEGNQATCVAGVCLMAFGYKPLSKIVTNLIPKPIQVGTAVGIGLITALAGALDINMVRAGKYTVVTSGPITTEVILTVLGVIVLVILLARHIQGAFSYVLIFNTFVWWWNNDAWPDIIAQTPQTNMGKFGHESRVDGQLTLSLLFLSVLVLRGLMKSFSQMAGLIKESGSTPKGSVIYLICGFITIISGLMSGPPVLISPESAAGIKAGAKTGLSTFVCGVLFCLTTFFAPFFKSIPSAATSPLLIVVGILLFQNVQRIDWSSIEEAAAAFTVLFFIPMAYSVLTGVLTGYIVYIIVLIFSVPFLTKFKRKFIDGIDDVEPKRQGEDEDYDEEEENENSMPSTGVNVARSTSSNFDAQPIDADTLSSSSKSQVSQRVGKAIYKHLTKESNFVVDMSSTLVVDVNGNNNAANNGSAKKFPRSRTIN